MLGIIEFIKSNSDWRETLAEPPYCITSSDDGLFTILKYSQIDSDFNLEIVRQCRGLIIDGNLDPVCIPFFKFGNYGEAYADKIDWNTARVEEKIDGSLIKVWNYKGEWHISTNGTIYADKALITPKGGEPGKFRSFGELFQIGAEKAGLDFSRLNPSYTYMFELCSPHNRIVVPHSETKIYHIGTRDNASLREMDVDIGIEKPRMYDCSDIGSLIEMASVLKYCEEGYVVKDADYRRIKVKSPSYVAVHHLISELSDKRLLDLIRKNEVAEFLTYFPEYKHYVDRLSEKTSALIEEIEQVLRDLIHGVTFETRKDFAMVATKTKFPAFLFQYYDGKVKNAKDWLWGQTNEKILEWLER